MMTLLTLLEYQVVKVLYRRSDWSKTLVCVLKVLNGDQKPSWQHEYMRHPGTPGTSFRKVLRPRMKKDLAGMSG